MHFTYQFTPIKNWTFIHLYMQYFARFAIANVTYDKFDEQSIKIVKKAMKTTDISDYHNIWIYSCNDQNVSILECIINLRELISFKKHSVPENLIMNMYKIPVLVVFKQFIAYIHFNYLVQYVFYKQMYHV